MTPIISKIYGADVQLISAINGCESLLRTLRYRKAGDFKLRIYADPAVISALFAGQFIVFSDRPREGWLIESIEPDINHPDDYAIVSGRDLKGLYDYRVVWKQMSVNGTAWNRMYWLLHYNAVAPAYAIRTMPFVQDLELQGDYAGETGNSQYTGDSLLDACTDILGSDNCGWRTELDIEEQKIRNIFYSGQDKTQSVVYNDALGNLARIQYIYSIQGSANAALVGGEGEGAARKYQAVEQDTSSGFARREMYVDARDLQSSSTDEDGNTITLSAAEYTQALRARGFEKLADNQLEQSISFSVNNSAFIYGQHYEMGDLVTVRNYKKLGIKAKCRVIAVQISDTSAGREITPEFEVVSMEVNT